MQQHLGKVFFQSIAVFKGSTTEAVYKLYAFVRHGGAMVRFGAFRPEGRRFESHSSHHVRTLEKSFTRNCQYGVDVLTPTQYQCCIGKSAAEWLMLREAL